MKSLPAFSLPLPRRAQPKTPEDAFVEAERPSAVFAANAAPEAAEAPQRPSARLSVDVPPVTLRKLKIAAVERGRTVRELVLDMLAREGF